MPGCAVAVARQRWIPGEHLGFSEKYIDIAIAIEVYEA
jgi:hypothetical protein